jgi:hypothetical protein
MGDAISLASALAAFLFVIVLSTDALGYIDPGTGSYVLQLLIAGLIGSLFVVKVFWKNIKGFVGNLFSRSPKADDDSK